MSTFLYARPSDRLTGTVVATTGDAAYPAANLDNGFPHKPAKLTGTTGNWVRTLAAPGQVDFAVVIHHNLAAGVDLRLQGHTADSWGAPDVNVAFTVPAAHVDGFTKNLWLDLSLTGSAASRTKQYWRLLVNSANTANVAVGEWGLYSAVRNFGIRNISKGSRRQILRPALVHETEYLVRRSYDLGTTLRSVDVNLEATDTTLADVDALFRSASGEVKAFPIVPNREIPDEAWFVTLIGPELEWAREHRNYNPLSLSFREASRGLPL